MVLARLVSSMHLIDVRLLVGHSAVKARLNDTGSVIVVVVVGGSCGGGSGGGVARSCRTARRWFDSSGYHVV